MWSLRALCALMRAVFALQAGPHPDRALHPHLRAGLRDSAGGDAEGHGLQHQEVPARPGSGRGSALLGLWGLAALSAPLLPGPALAPSTGLQGGLRGSGQLQWGGFLGVQLLAPQASPECVWQVGSVLMLSPWAAPGHVAPGSAPPGCTRPLRPHWQMLLSPDAPSMGSASLLEWLTAIKEHFACLL